MVFLDVGHLLLALWCRGFARAEGKGVCSRLLSQQNVPEGLFWLVQ